MLLLGLAAAGARAEPGRQDLRLSLEGDRVVARLGYSDPRAGEVLAALEDGLASEIQFQLRLFRRQRAPFGFLGDRLVSELRLVRTARYDRFQREYRIQSPAETEGRHAEAQDFLEAFFALGPLPLGVLAAEEAGQYYVQSRVRLSPVKIVFPLKLITLFYPQAASPWLRGEL